MVDTLEDKFFRFPTVNGQSESTLRDKVMAFDRLELLASPVPVRLVISADHDDPAGNFDPDLSGTKNVTGGMKGYRGVADLVFLTEGNAFEFGLLAQPQMKKRQTGIGTKIILVTRTGMITVCMGDEGSFNRAFGIDVKIACRTIKPGGRYGKRFADIV